jgi:hypothetical protein
MLQCFTDIAFELSCVHCLCGTRPTYQGTLCSTPSSAASRCSPNRSRATQSRDRRLYLNRWLESPCARTAIGRRWHAKMEASLRVMDAVRCPYCVEGDGFKEMSARDPYLICRKCGHVILPGMTQNTYARVRNAKSYTDHLISDGNRKYQVNNKARSPWGKIGPACLGLGFASEVTPGNIRVPTVRMNSGPHLLLACSDRCYHFRPCG